MRLALLASAAFILPFEAEAATVISGTIEPQDLISSIDTSDFFSPLKHMPEGSKINVTFTISQGIIAEVSGDVDAYYTSTWKFPVAEDSGVETHITDLCSFNGAGPDGCFQWDYDEDGIFKPYPAAFTSNFSVGAKSLSYTVFRPVGFHHCDKPIYFPTVCEEDWSLSSTMNISVAGRKPFTYTLSYSDPIGGSAVPEPASWAMMLAGFGLAGGALRKQRKQANHQHVSFT